MRPEEDRILALIGTLRGQIAAWSSNEALTAFINAQLELAERQLRRGSYAEGYALIEGLGVGIKALASHRVWARTEGAVTP